MVRNIISAALAATSLALAAAPAAAVPADGAYVATVSTAGLDLSTRAGQRALMERTRYASRQVCGRAPVFGAADEAAIEACRSELAASVRAAAAARAAGAGARGAGR